MTPLRSAALALLVAATVSGAGPVRAAAQDTDPEPIPSEIRRGRTADIRLLDARLTGELLAWERDTLWVAGDGRTLALPVTDVGRLRIHRHGLDTRAVLVWTALGAAASAVGMTVACSQVESDCGYVPLVVIGSWGLVGGLLGWAVASTSRQDVLVTPQAVRPYLRFPGGLPDRRRVPPP